jgi:heme-degrading monooxygenase HmoA
MFVRIARTRLKPGLGPGYARAIEEKVIPILRRFAGFRDEIAMLSTDGKEALGISFWDTQEHAEAYDRAAFNEVRSAIAPYIASAAELQTYNVTASTIAEHAAMIP